MDIFVATETSVGGSDLLKYLQIDGNKIHSNFNISVQLLEQESHITNRFLISMHYALFQDVRQNLLRKFLTQFHTLPASSSPRLVLSSAVLFRRSDDVQVFALLAVSVHH